MAEQSNHAIVFGAAGLLGWSVVNQLLSGYPRAGSFSKVTAVVNRPVSEADLCLPETSPQRPALQVVSGIDLLQGSGDALARQLADRVPDAGRITHVFYFVFSSFNEDHVRECEINCEMMQRVADAANILTSSLQSFVYPGGTRGYGIYVPGGTFTAPLQETLADQLPEDYARTCAYPWFRQTLTKASRGRSWSWTEVCPDAVVGFSPHGSAFSLALHWAQYLSLYAFNHGIQPGKVPPSGKEIRVAFPGCQEAFDSKFTPVSGKILGRISIHAALNPGTCGGKVVNMADNDRPTSFSKVWPAIASWFGLVGVGPAGDEGALKPGEYVAKHKQAFAEQNRPKALKCGVGAGSAQLDAVGWWLKFDRHLSLERLRVLGFQEQRDPVEGWLGAFEQFRAAGIIL
ncbi:sirq protein [Hirsutella rhossiliensis]|uniref:Sirq protein n=1 Tax=Hirsutella rhossiliensis TaxID=111463 RepID=A0A9P8MZ49_9HYPO|nr:sirq protein [Hirsutella rhossiliensis]KAH0963652.1 sirq protein [Hirsutella rhossiliensis]